MPYEASRSAERITAVGSSSPPEGPGGSNCRTGAADLGLLGPPSRCRRSQEHPAAVPQPAPLIEGDRQAVEGQVRSRQGRRRDRQPHRRLDPSSRLPKWTSIMKNVISCKTTSNRGVRFGLIMLVERVPICEMTPSGTSRANAKCESTDR